MRSNLITVMDRTFETIKALRSPITTKDLQGRLECSHSQAWKYLQTACIALPVVCLNEEDEDRGREALIYQLVEEL